MPRTVLTIIGTRPEAIKLGPVVLELQRRQQEFRSVVCVTAQHRQMLDQVLSVFNILPDHDLDIMLPGQSLAQVTARAMTGLDDVIGRVQPHIAIVQGDTTTAFCGALAAHYHRVTVAHIEAGLRTGNKFSPFPEEMNRRLVGRLADQHFAPTRHAHDTLLREGVDPASVHLTGNTVIDALLWVRARVSGQTPAELLSLESAINGHPFVLVTGHRRESFGHGFENICKAIRAVADACSDVHFVYPVHLNPNVRKPVNRLLANHARIHLIEPLAYEPFVWLMDRSTVVLTDSGGVQEEAPSLGKPVLVMRETTERPEGIAAGNARLVGTCQQTITRELANLLADGSARTAMAGIANPYGDGTAARRICDVLAGLAGI
jgi:UDP-N-acetylglucosamine 2-epimerase (non-hydrolysing)